MNNEETPEQQYDRTLLAKDAPVKFKKSTYNFTNGERARVIGYEIQLQLAQVAERLLNSFLLSVCMNRVSEKNAEQTQIVYDTAKGVFIVYQPIEEKKKAEAVKPPVKDQKQKSQ